MRRNGYLGIYLAVFIVVAVLMAGTIFILYSVDPTARGYDEYAVDVVGVYAAMECLGIDGYRPPYGDAESYVEDGMIVVEVRVGQYRYVGYVDLHSPNCRLLRNYSMGSG